MKLIYKLYSTGEELSANEKMYLKKWVQDIKENKDRNILNLRDSLLPERPSKLTVNNLDSKTMYTLNSVSKVHLDRDMHG